jgi:fucose permease
VGPAPTRGAVGAGGCRGAPATHYLQQILGLSPIEAGLVYLPCTVLIFFVSGASAGLLQKGSAGALIAVGLAFVAIGLALGLLATPTSSWAMLIPSLMVGGLAPVSSTRRSARSRSAPRRRR